MTPRHRSRTPWTILGCLSLGPMSGYDIKKFIDRTISHFWSESYGQIYPALRDLESERLVEGRMESGEAGPDRRVYSLTAAGLDHLRAWLVEPPIPDVPRYEMSLKLFFGAQMPVEAALEHVGRYRTQQAAVLAEYRTRGERLERELAGDPRLPFWRLVLQGGVEYAEMAIRWCDEAAAELRALDPEAYPTPPRRL